MLARGVPTPEDEEESVPSFGSEPELVEENGKIADDVNEAALANSPLRLRADTGKLLEQVRQRLSASSGAVVGLDAAGEGGRRAGSRSQGEARVGAPVDGYEAWR